MATNIFWSHVRRRNSDDFSAVLAPHTRACRKTWSRRRQSNVHQMSWCYGTQLTFIQLILLPGLLASIMFTAVTIIYVYWAQGDRHIWDIQIDKTENLALCLWLAEFSFLVCGGLTKISVLLFYRRLVDGTYSRRWKWLVIFAIAFTAAYSIAFCIMLLVNCTPTEAYWRAFDPKYALTQDYTCLDTRIINTLAGVFAAASDVYAVALPCIITWHFSVPRAQKIALNIIFSLGLLIVAASGVRTYYLMGKLLLLERPFTIDANSTP